MKLIKKWADLQNGSDIRGVALDINPEETVNLTSKEVDLITRGFIVFLTEKYQTDNRMSDKNNTMDKPANMPAENKKITENKEKSKPVFNISVGVDSRLSGPALKDAALNAIVSSGHQALDCGMASTPAMFMSCIYPQTRCDGAIMITASHLPSNRNGMKFFTPEGGAEKGDITSILYNAQKSEKKSGVEDRVGDSVGDRVRDGVRDGDKNKYIGIDAADVADVVAAADVVVADLVDDDGVGDIVDDAEDVKVSEDADSNAAGDTKVKKFNLIDLYSDDLLEKIRKGANSPDNYEKPLEGLKIVVDAGNGAGGFFAHKVLQPLGADISGSQFLDPDGHFPNHIPNPENKEAMESIVNSVIENKADLGIIFDTDVDRAAAVDKNGQSINRNKIVALMAAIVLEEHPGTTIVTDSITSQELKVFIESKLGGRHHRFKRGYKNVINEAIRLNSIGEETHLAIETSGHGALKENYFLDDGAYMVAKILIKVAQMKQKSETIDLLLEELKDPLEAEEFRLNINCNDFGDYGKKVLADLEEYVKNVNGWTAEEENYEGIRVRCDEGSGNGWFLLRMSLHDPVLPLNAESNTRGGIKRISGILLEFFKKYDDLDLKSITKYLD